MTEFISLKIIPQILILIIFLGSLLVNGYIAVFSAFRLSRWKTGIFAFSLSLLYFIIITSLAVFLHEIELGVKPNPLSYYFAALPLWIYGLLLFIGGYFSIFQIFSLRSYHKNTITKASIKESLDNLPAGLCLSLADSLVILSNRQIERLSYILTGQDLQNGEDFWNTIKEGTLLEGNKRLRKASNPIITLSDGHTWSFKRRTIQVEGQSVIEITAIDTTDLDALRIQLEKENQTLEEIGERLKKYSQNIAGVKAKEERLATKMRIHDEIGYALLATRQFLRKDRPSPIMDYGAGEILDIWKRNIPVLKGDLKVGHHTALDSLITAAEAIGIRLLIEGDMPEDKPISNLILLAASECLTNALRHAQATELYIKILESPENFIAIFSNNGEKPPSEIIEGGGLWGIRQKVQVRNGKMEISHSPQFMLKIEIPKSTV